MDQDASESDFEFISHDFLRSWYLRDGKKRIPTLNQAHTKEMKKEDNMQTPLQLIALIHRGHPMTHKPWWPRVFLPILCPTSLALEEMYKHWFYSTKRDEGRVLKFSLASKKMAFHLGYTIQVFWILTTKRPLGPLPTAAQPEPMTNFFDSEPNIRYLAVFFGKLWLKLWKQRRGVLKQPEKMTDPDSVQPESWWSSWKTSKGSMDNWRDLEGALATLWRIFTHEKEEVPKEETWFGLQFPADLDSMREWEYVQLSAKEEAWYGISGDGPGTMSPLGLGLKEAERVQRHWEEEKKWVYPMYPAEWEGWAVV